MSGEGGTRLPDSASSTESVRALESCPSAAVVMAVVSGRSLMSPRVSGWDCECQQDLPAHCHQGGKLAPRESELASRGARHTSTHAPDKAPYSNAASAGSCRGPCGARRGTLQHDRSAAGNQTGGEVTDLQLRATPEHGLPCSQRTGLQQPGRAEQNEDHRRAGQERCVPAAML